MKEQGCGVGSSRREFVRASAAAAALLAAGRGRVMAGPFTRADFDRFVPADKRLAPDWVRALHARGEPEIYREAGELAHIGMPVGGICCGQLYLGGDGRLWHWDIFNAPIRTGAEHYARPMENRSPVEQGFALRIDGGAPRPLAAGGFEKIAFRGEYPIGRVEYREATCPVEVDLEAFSPFIPLDLDASSLPVTVMRYRVKNRGASALNVEIGGWLGNPVCLHTAQRYRGERVNRVCREGATLMLECDAREIAGAAPGPERAPILFADFEGGSYGEWRVEGEAFGRAPGKGAVGIQKLSGFQGGGLANSWTGSDVPQGHIISPEFTIERRVINFLIGGGKHPGETCINLVIDGEIARGATGENSDSMVWASWWVEEFEGRRARIEIVDRHSGGWGHIDIDQIEFADRARAEGDGAPFDKAHDRGTIALALLEADGDARARARIGAGSPSGPSDLASALFDAPDGASEVAAPLRDALVGGVVRRMHLAPGTSGEATFVIAWSFPNLTLDRARLNDVGRYCAERFPAARAAVAHLVESRARLFDQTRLWRDTWYDSSLPYWFLDRTLANASTLATSTCHRFRDGRFYAWEGVGCCAGTCTHVWHYAQSVARLFPDLERDLRERVDFGLAFDRVTGRIGFRGEFHGNPAIDGQAGVILRTLREHRVSASDDFLRRVWTRARRALEFLIGEDRDGDGIIEGAQHNTLDADWHGPVAWLSGLYLAALRAGEEMALVVGDAWFARRAREIFERGRARMAEILWGGEYFVNRPDPAQPGAINSGTGCHIDQVFGQGWAFQVGLGRVLPERETRAALGALWRYNFSPDVGPYREANPSGRWYAMAGEAGLLMCTFPRTDWDFERARGAGNQKPGFAGYFNECMTGFEYQVASHMIWEGMTLEGFAVARAVHDRYHAARRNPWNEVECGDHYARAMASHGVYLAACGFEYDGPSGVLGFAPRIGADRFRAAFTAAEGWGTIDQRLADGGCRARIELRWGALQLREVRLAPGAVGEGKRAVARVGEETVGVHVEREAGCVRVRFAIGIGLVAGQTLEIEIS